MSVEIIVCARCGRSMNVGACRFLGVERGRKRYVCRGLMAPSCARIAKEKGEPDPVSPNSTVE